MKKLLSIIVSCLIMAQAQAVVIQAEESPGQFIRATETVAGYTFEQCQVIQDSEKCYPIFNGTTFSRSELDDLSDRNARYAIYAVAGDGAAIVGGFVVGLYAGLAFLSYNGAALAAGAFLYGGVPAGTAGAASTIAFDNLDPFVHRDTSIAYDAIIGTADEDDLEDVDSYVLDNELAVVIEDINFRQLEKKIKGQLADIKGMDIEELERESSNNSGLY